MDSKIIKDNRIKNVLFLTIDSLRYDRLYCNGYPLNTTPTIDSLIKDGISCSNAFTYSHPTQFAFPSLFTSTLPLDFGGYDNGISQRPITLAQVLKANGYKTVAFSTSPWLGRFFGYERGFDEFYELFDIEVLWGNIANIYVPYFKKLKDKQAIKEVEFRKIIESLLRNLFLDIVTFCEQKRDELQSKRLKYNRHIYNHDFKLLERLVSEKLGYLNTPSSVDLLNCLERIPGRDLYTFVGMPKRAMMKKVKEICITIIKKMLRTIYIQVSRYDFKYDLGVNAEYVTNNIIDYIGKNLNTPLFLWAHFLDIHNFNCISGKIGLPPGYRELYGKRFKLGRTYYGNLQYDFSVRYVDENIKKIVDFLKQKELLEKTLIVVCSDHGSAIAGMPKRRFLQTPVGEGYEEFIRIPIIFYNTNLKLSVIQNLCTTIDIAPTVLDLIGIDPIKEFKGLPVYSLRNKERKYVLLENLGGGPCDIARKPINIVVRTKKYKYIFREFNSGKEKQPRPSRELYDLCADPEEKNNIVEVKECAELKRELETIAKRRCLEIRQGI